MRKALSLLLIVILMLSVCLGVTAASSNDGDVSVMSLQNSSVSLSISGVTATTGASVSALDSDSINATLYLQKYKDGAWTTVKSKSGSSTNEVLKISFSKLITAGQFRAKLVSKVTKGSETETITSYSGVKTKE